MKMINSSNAASIVTTPMVIWGPMAMNVYLFQEKKVGVKSVGCVSVKCQMREKGAACGTCLFISRSVLAVVGK
jgi:hypothetical protein